MIGKIHGAFRIEPLGAGHERETFSCGVPELDGYIRQQAGQDLRRKLATVFVLTLDGRQVAGYYTLSAHTINARELPEDLGRKLPKFPIPVTLLGRMAVGNVFRGQGLGRFILMDALQRLWQSSQQIASWAVVVDAEAGARDFYLEHEFIQLPGKPDRLFLPMKTIEELVSG